jgi:hypothetical protein
MWRRIRRCSFHDLIFFAVLAGKGQHLLAGNPLALRLLFYPVIIGIQR